DGKQPRPALFVLDPRGRADLALSLFAPAAESLGYVVLSSYRSASDVDDSVNVSAMNAMLERAQSRLNLDLNRLYIAGMSGTARAAALFAMQGRPHFAGVIMASAGFPPRSDFERLFQADSTFAVFATTGRRDFNYGEVRQFYSRLVDARVPARLSQSDGAHG